MKSTEAVEEPVAESDGAPISVAASVVEYPAVSLTMNEGNWLVVLGLNVTVGMIDQLHVKPRLGKLFGELAMPFSCIVKQLVLGVFGKGEVVKLTVGAVLTTTAIGSELDPIESCTVKVVA